MADFEWPDEVVDYFHTLTGGWGEDGVLDYFKTFVDKALVAAWERGFAEGEKHERSLWQWQAGGLSRAVNGLDRRPVAPENPYGEPR